MLDFGLYICEFVEVFPTYVFLNPERFLWYLQHVFRFLYSISIITQTKVCRLNKYNLYIYSVSVIGYGMFFLRYVEDESQPGGVCLSFLSNNLPKCINLLICT